LEEYYRRKTSELREEWPRSSVIVWAYQAQDTIEECLRSLTGLDYPNHEVLVVDDGSTDATAQILRRFSGRVLSRCVLHGLTVQRGPSEPSTKGTSDGPTPAYPLAPHLEEAMTVLFCLIDDAYRLLNPRGARRHESIKRLSDSEIITLALLQQLRGVESERSFLRDAQRFFSELFPGVAGLYTLPPSTGV
jgi:Glycosyl transferase family 2